ncbi:unnamed protein product [Thelazia callipaeda]|uniref:Schwannomin-interacting protein 1 n=1 Tax=Thelazia callipaeda TaxID=103827 RepID=A0A0N5D7R1_THECL|nr:unnamed protein product [Thelazia callipaeda]
MSNVERKYHVQLTSKITEHWLCERNNLDSSIENDGISICHQSYGKRHEVSAPTLHSTANERIKVPESSKTDSPHKGILIPTYYYPICCQSTSNSLKSRNITCEASYIDKPLELTKIQCRNNSNIVGHLHTERSKYETLEDPGVFVSDRLQETVNISNVPHKSCIDDFTKRVNVSSNVEVFPYSYYDDSDDDSNFLKELKKESSIREGSNSQLIKKEFRSELGATGNCRDFLKLMDHTETVKDCNKCKESEALLIHRATVKNECEHKQPLLGYIQANGNSKNNEATRTANNKLDLSCKFSRNEKRTMRDSYNTTSPWHQYSSQLSTKLNEKNLTNSISSHGPLMPSSVTAEKKFRVPNVSEWYQQTVMLPRNAEGSIHHYFEYLMYFQN